MECFIFHPELNTVNRDNTLLLKRVTATVLAKREKNVAAVFPPKGKAINYMMLVVSAQSLAFKVTCSVLYFYK